MSMINTFNATHASALAEAILALSGIKSVSEFEKQLEAGREIIEERCKKRKKTAERKEISRQAKGLVAALICAHGASTASEGTQSEVIVGGISETLAGVLRDVFPNMPQEGPAAGFPIRQLRSRIRELHQSGKIDEQQMKVLVCAVRKAKNAVAGDNANSPKPTKRDKKGGDIKEESKGRRAVRGPRTVTEVLLNGMPGTIRSRANKLKNKPGRQIPESPACELLSADCERYYEALESVKKGLGHQFAGYSLELTTHEHERRDEERFIEWMAQFPPAPPEILQALLADYLDWDATGRKDDKEK